VSQFVDSESNWLITGSINQYTVKNNIKTKCRSLPVNISVIQYQAVHSIKQNTGKDIMKKQKSA